MKKLFFALSIISLPIMAVSQVAYKTVKSYTLQYNNELEEWICNKPEDSNLIWEVQIGRIFCEAMDRAYFKILKYVKRGDNEIYLCEGVDGYKVSFVTLNRGEKIVLNLNVDGERYAIVYEVEKQRERQPTFSRPENKAKFILN